MALPSVPHNTHEQDLTEIEPPIPEPMSFCSNGDGMDDNASQLVKPSDHHDEGVRYQASSSTGLRSARPTQGALRLPVKPPPLNHTTTLNLLPGLVRLTREDPLLSLDKIPSDGEARFWPADPLAQPWHYSTRFANILLSQPVVRDLAGGRSFHMASMPRGYKVFGYRRDRERHEKMDNFVFGHPSGKKFPSVTTWGVHLVSMLKEDLTNCTCCLCTPWRSRAPEDAIIHTGLPRIPGGAVAAALNHGGAADRDMSADSEGLAPSSAVSYPDSNQGDDTGSPTADHQLRALLSLDLSSTNHTREELEEAMQYAAEYAVTSIDVDLVMLAAIADEKHIWEGAVESYTENLPTNTEEMNATWKKWFNEQALRMEALKGEVKDRKACLASNTYLMRASAVKNLPQWQRDIVIEAIAKIAASDSQT